MQRREGPGDSCGGSTDWVTPSEGQRSLGFQEDRGFEVAVELAPTESDRVENWEPPLTARFWFLHVSWAPGIWRVKW